MRNILLTVLFILLAATPTSAGDYGGVWKAHVTESMTTCEEIGRDKVGEYTIEIFQSEKKVIVQAQRPNVRYTGKFLADDPNAIHLNSTYEEDGGYVTELVDLFFENGATAHGNVVWTWSDGLYTCGGTYQFNLKR